MRLMIRTHQPGQNTLNPDTLCRQTPRLIGAVTGNQNDFVVLAFQDFQRSLAFIDQRNDDFAVIGRIGFLIMTVSPSRIPASIIESPSIVSA